MFCLVTLVYDSFRMSLVHQLDHVKCYKFSIGGTEDQTKHKTWTGKT